MRSLYHEFHVVCNDCEFAHVVEKGDAAPAGPFADSREAHRIEQHHADETGHDVDIDMPEYY